MADLTNSFKLISMNVRGFRNKKQRRVLFSKFKKEKYDIICLQETRITNKELSFIKREWLSDFHISEGTNRSKGLLTLFGKNLNIKNSYIHLANDRCLISHLTLENDSKLAVVNIYAPCVPSEKPAFIESCYDYINESTLCDITYNVVMGDFNLMRNNDLDNIAGEPHDEKHVESFNTLLNDLLLVDIWREINPNKRDFTWSRAKPYYIARRLDYIFVSENLLPYCRDPILKYVGFSDHKAVIVNLDFASFKRGPSLYKFNVSLLKNKYFIDDVTSEITRIKLLQLDPLLAWEYIKIAIKDIAMSYGRGLAHNKRNTKSMLTDRIDHLEKQLTIFPTDESILNSYSEAKTKYELLLMAEAEGARIRAGQKWAEEGEKCSKFFLNLEKQRSNANTIFRIKSDLNPSEYFTDPHEILEAISNYFKKIYSDPSVQSDSSFNDDIFLAHDGDPILTDDDNVLLDSELSEAEVLKALKLSNNKSAPGLDGLPCEVYKVFWKDIKGPLLACFNQSFNVGFLTESQSTGMICLHHKGKGQCRDQLSSWRPISLTNTDYKLIAKSLAIRMNTVLFKCVSPDQHAFIKGRQIGDLLREMDDIIEFGKKYFPNSIILSVDYAKAFDSLSISSIKKALVYFGFGEHFRRWIDILLYNRKSCVRNGGYISDSFDMNRGVRQGCPISPLLFILTLELLARDIRRNVNVKGIQLAPHTLPVKIKLYADDATFFLSDMIDYREVLSRIKLFSHFSGLCLNKSKSAAMFIGDTTRKDQMKYGIKFVNSIKVLGVIFSNQMKASENEHNFIPKIQQLERIISLWSKRHLTIIGKITVLKSFGLPLFIYLMQSIGVNENYMKTINSIMFRYIWDTKGNTEGKVIEKVKREYVCRSKEQGGLGMIDMTKMQQSFYLKWADKLLDNNMWSWKTIPTISLNPVGGISVFKCSVAGCSFKGIGLIKNSFWKEVLICWLNNKNQHPVTTECRISDPIFNNSAITFKRNTLFIERCIRRSMIFIKDFFIEETLMSFEQFRNTFGVSSETQLAYNIIFNALKRVETEIKASFDLSRSVEEGNHNPILFRDIEVGSLSRRGYYNLIVSSDVIPVNKYFRENLLLEENTPGVWMTSLECTKEVKLIELQWKIMHNIYYTGTLLKKTKIKPSDICELCGEVDTLIHFFVSCCVVQEVWKEAERVLFRLTGLDIRLNERMILAGVTLDEPTFSNEHKRIINLICLLGKRSISKFKFEKTGRMSIIFERELWIRKLLD